MHSTVNPHSAPPSPQLEKSPQFAGGFINRVEAASELTSVASGGAAGGGGSWLSRSGLHLGSVALFFGVWWLATLFISRSVLSTPQDTIRAFFELLGQQGTLLHVSRTLLRIALGFLIAELLGIVMGTMMGLRHYFERTLDVWLMVGLTVPSLCWAIISLMIFGLTEAATIAAIAISTFPMVAVNIWGGVKSVNTKLVEMATAFRVSKVDTIRLVIFPQILPYIFSSSRYGIGIAWKIAVVVEMLGASNGVGYMLHYWFGMFSMVRVFAWTMLLVLIMSFIEFGLIRAIERRVLAWRPEVKL